LKNAIWTLSNFCRHKDPPPSYETVTQLLPTVTSLLHHSDKGVSVHTSICHCDILYYLLPKVVGDACRIFSYLTDSSIDRIEVRVVHMCVCVWDVMSC